MTTQPENNLANELSGLTQWGGGKTTLWREALKSTKPTKGGRDSILHRVAAWRPSKWTAASAAVAALSLIAVAINLADRAPTGGSVRRARALVGRNSPGPNTKYAYQYQPDLRGIGHALTVGSSSRPTFPPPTADAWSEVRAMSLTPRQFISPSTSPPSSNESGAARETALRRVIRKATIILKSTDVRAAFLKAQLIVRPASGEYVQDSALIGEGEAAQANLTLRIVADRLGDVLNELRQLGQVTSERKEGQDVTAQVVDVEARLRNEERVEVEILELLEGRREAPLKDILAMRDKLAEIRREIERLTGQRLQLSKMVSLATVLVIIRASDAPEPEYGSLAAYFGESIGNAWNAGLFFLSDTLATMLRIIVGGLVFWAILAAVILLIGRRRKRNTSTEEV